MAPETAQPKPVPVIGARSLGRRFRSVVALDGVSLDVLSGEVFGIVGADGSGKTTLLQMLAAILDPTSGSCEVLGFDTVERSDAVTARIGYMSQGFTLYERLTVGENLEFAAAVRSVEPRLLDERRGRLLRMAGLEPFTGRRADRLSGGMKKKLALCTNLVHEPRVLLLDEPSLGVDPLSRRELWALLEDYRRRGAAIVLATSYMDEAERCDRLAFLHEGRVLASGSPRDLKALADGTVFEATVTDPARVERELAADPRVRAFARLPSKLRFQLARESSAGAGTEPAIAGARAVPARLEDMFAVLAPAGRRREAAAPIAALTAAPDPGGPTGTSSSAISVQARGVTCRFGDFTAVEDISLDLRAGEVFGFLGPNGAGKTTLIRIFCGLQPFHAGEVTVAGLSVPRETKRLRWRIGYMSQRFSLYPDLTVGENLEFFAGVYGIRGVARAAAIDWAVETAGLHDIGDRRVGEISGAVRQRLALACSVMHRPRILFLDEPTSGVDPLSRHRFWRLVHELAAQGITALVTTHYLEEASYCHRLGLMFRGRFVGIGTLAELRDRSGLPESSGVEDVFLRYIEDAHASAQLPLGTA